MTAPTDAGEKDGKVEGESLWGLSAVAETLKSRLETFWNADYLERIVLPLLDIPQGGLVLDVGSGYGVLTLLLARLRPDMDVMGVDLEPKVVAVANNPSFPTIPARPFI